MTCTTCTPAAGPVPAARIDLPGVLRLDHVARQWIGVPFAHQGRSRRGVDCVGLVAVCCAAIPEFSHHCAHDLKGYVSNPHGGTLEAALSRAFGAPVTGYQPGDVVACAFPRVVRHVAIVAAHPQGGLSLIHALNKDHRRVIEHRLDARWSGFIRAAFRPEARP